MMRNYTLGRNHQIVLLEGGACVGITAIGVRHELPLVTCTIPMPTMQKHILAEVEKIIPSLTGALHKGQAGRVGVVGGSRE